MKGWIAVGVLMGTAYLLSYLAPLAPASVLENESSVKLAGAAIFALPIIGLVMAVRQFSRWHRSYHARVRERGLWR